MKTRPLVLSIVFVLLLTAGVLTAIFVGNVKPLLGLDLVGGLRVVLTAPEDTEMDVLERTLETIRNRVDAFGVAEPDIAIIGDRNIEVQIPRFQAQVGEADDQTRLLDLIGSTARLEEREVLEGIPPGSPTYETTDITCPVLDDPTPECTNDELDGEEVVFPGEPLVPGPDDEELPTKYRLGPVRITGDAIRRGTAVFASASQGDTFTGWYVAFDLTSEGRELFGQITTELQGRQLAIVLDRFVESAPTIEEPITTGSGRITGNFSEEEAKDLALTLQTGALPIELTKSEVQTVSPTLGEESLRAGLFAGVAGVIILALYLAFYYRLLGVVTWFGMAIWAILGLGMTSLLGRTVGYSLTLAGIAGFIISIGIAGDSYIVFYERLKDEVRHGKTPRAAVQPAFRRAWKTIIAANLVTILAAAVLYVLAIGSVRGFALTLGISTALDMFVVWFFKRPTVILLARSKRLSNLRGFGLRSGIAADPVREPVPVAGGAK